MMLQWTKNSIIAFILIVLSAPASFAAGKEFRLGLISDKPVGRINQYAPVARYTAKRLEAYGITHGKIVVAKNVDAMVEKIRKGEVDMVFESAFPTIELKKKVGIIPKLLVWKKGSSEYHSVIFVRKDSPIYKISDLKGKTIVFEDPLSTSAYLLPKADLRSNGLMVLATDEKKGETEAVRYIFGGEETNEIFYVLKKKADAGAFSSDDWREMPVGQKRELRIIHETKPVLRFIASFNPSLSADLRIAISSILTNMDNDPEGQKILKGAARIEKVEELSDLHYQSLEDVHKLMNALGK